MVLCEKGEGIKKKKKPEKTLIDTDDSTVITRGKGAWREGEEGKGEISGDGRRLNLGWGTHNTIYR